MSVELKHAAQRALDDICGAKLCEINSMSSRREMIRLMDCAIDELRSALALQQAQATQAGVTDSMIREAFLANGFTIKDGHSDLKPYVYAAARAILALRPERVPMPWPKARDVGRFGDMSPSAHMRVGLDGDNDVYVSVWDETGGVSIEFCTPGAGGGSSSRTRQALIDLMVAMEEDNAERPDKDWWARRMGGITAQAKKEGA